MKMEKKAKGKAKGKAIIGIAIAAIMLASVFALMIGGIGAYSVGGAYNIIEKDMGATAQPVIIGQDLDFFTYWGSAESDRVTIYRVKEGVVEWTKTADPGNTLTIAGDDWKKEGAFYVNYNTTGPAWDAQLSFSDPDMPLELKVGTKTVSSIAVGTTLTIDTSGINLFPQDRVDLVVNSPMGVIVYDGINDQQFRNISVSDLINWYKNGGLKTKGWTIGDYTFQIKTKPECACGLDIKSYKKTLDITKAEVAIEASKTDSWINESIILTVRAPPYHNITIRSFDTLNTVFEGGKYDYSGPDTGGPINDMMDEDGVRYYAVHFTDTGMYTIFVEDLDAHEYMDDYIDITVSEPEILKLEVEDDNKLRVNFNTYLLDDDRVDLKIINPEGTALSFNPTNPSQSFCNITVQTVKDMLINTSGWDSGRYTTWIETNESYIPVLEVHSNPVVFEIDEDRIKMIPTTFLFDCEPPYLGEDGGVITIGDDILLYGTATKNSTIDIALDDKVVKTNIPIQESGSFVDIFPIDNLAPGFNEIEAFIDTPFVLGDDVTGIENNGSSNILLKSNERISSLYGDGYWWRCNVIIIGNDLTIYGTATGGTSVDIALEDEIVAVDVLIAEDDGAFVVSLPTPLTPHTDTVGVKEIKAFIDSPFTLGENVSEAESSGDSSVFLVEGVGAGEIGVYAEKNESVVLNRVRIVVVGTAGHNIIVGSSDPSHTIFPGAVEDNPYPPSIPFNHTIDGDGIRNYVVYFNETGTYTITVTDANTGNNDTEDISVDMAKVVFDMVDTCTIGDRLLIKGYASTGCYVDIAIEDEVLPQLNDLVIKENGEFSKWIATSYYVPGSIKIAAYIDRYLGSGTIGPYEEDDGNTTVLLTNPTLSAYLSKNEVSQRGAFRIWGVATGAWGVETITISPNGGNGTGLDGDTPLFPDTNVTGITHTVLPISKMDDGFTTRIDVDRNADSGTYKVIATVPGKNGTYDGLWWGCGVGELLDGIIAIYCSGDPDVLASMTQEELVEMVKNATINAPDSDDLLNELCLSVTPELGDRFDTGPGTYPSIMGMHNGTIKTLHNINISRLYTYPCSGTGGHIESIKLYDESGNQIANGTWKGYQGDWHNITIHNVTGAPYVRLLKEHKYNYTIRTGSYPQIIHNQTLTTKNGTITCTEFTDANGRRYNNWIPAIRLE